MKNFTYSIFMALCLLFGGALMAQETITGRVNDNANMPLPAASVKIKGTNVSASTDTNGVFTLTTGETSGSLVVDYVGFTTQTLSFTITPGTTLDMGTITLAENAEELEGVVIIGKGVIDLEQDRRTPVAVSNISRREIQQKSGNQEFPEIMKNTPGIYVASQAGGFGDSKMYVRGFDQTNTAFLLNGQPINGMEDGNMYWSNWSGMTDVANSVQVQRGLGSSKLAISSVGGTVNIVTKATDMRKGGFAQSIFGNDNYQKNTIGYNTGIMDNGFGMSMMLTKWSADGYNRGTYGEGYNYFLSFGYRLNEKHLFNFLVFGAPQLHDQNFTKQIASYLRYGRKYNNNYGFLDGDYLSERRNYYHKPVLNLNWDYNISDKMNLSTVLYASYGRGGGTGNFGASSNKKYTADGHIDFTTIRNNNMALPGGIGEFSNSYLIRNSVNNHAWHGLVSNFNHKINDNFNYNIGLDLRTYKGTHYREVSNFMGLSGYKVDDFVQHPDGFIVTEQFSANPWSAFTNNPSDTQKIDYDYDERINYGGIFGQAEYATDDFSVFVQGAVSNQSHVRWDRQQYTRANEKSDKVNNTGYNIKGGASYIVAEQHTVFANAGFYSRQPYHDNIYLNFGNQVNPLTENEKITGIEAGYRFRSAYFDADVNAYRTTWKDRVTTTVDTDDNNNEVFLNNSGVNQLHTGIEIEATARPFDGLSLHGFGSFGNWKYDEDVYMRTFDQNQNLTDQQQVNVEGGKVGGAAQTVWGLGAIYTIGSGISIDADWRNYDNLYATVVTKDNVELPAFDLVDIGATYRLDFTKTSLQFRVNVNNLFGEVFLTELTSAIKTTDDVDSTDPLQGTYQSNGRVYKGIATANNGFFGNGRTYNISMRFNF
ncbi:TonB-dependent receptor [uncultured Flavobacterium sp.]|uniref:TonB-dependent receptor n=1 Tax=uncultured Flavobacterium sp. TaxID=165435 RepID=UPI0025E50B8A|nr:TonB-dependent receptor [uncultured Flavobacterium sp.]